MALSGRFGEALAYAAQLHALQTRKGSDVPYVAHLLSVAALALEHGANEDEAIAALLHDAVEDQGGAVVADEIRRRFGDNVAEIVAGCTDADATPKPPWRARKEAHVARLRQAGPSIRLVCACDKLHNVRSVIADYQSHGEKLWAIFTGGREGTLWYYRSVTDVLRSDETALAVKLDAAVCELEQLVAIPRD